MVARGARQPVATEDSASTEPLTTFTQRAAGSGPNIVIQDLLSAAGSDATDE